MLRRNLALERRSLEARLQLDLHLPPLRLAHLLGVRLLAQAQGCSLGASRLVSVDPQPTELRHLRGPLLRLLLILLRIVVVVLVRPLLLRLQLLLRRRRLVLSRSVLLRDQLERLCIW